MLCFSRGIFPKLTFGPFLKVSAGECRHVPDHRKNFFDPYTELFFSFTELTEGNKS